MTDYPTLAEACLEPAPDVRIVPGVALRDGARPDVMRGEEIQVFGAIGAGAAPAAEGRAARQTADKQ